MNKYSDINKSINNDLNKVTLRQGRKFKKYQSKIEKSVIKKNLLFEGFKGIKGFEGMENLHSNSVNLMGQVDTVISQYRELQNLQNSFNVTLQSYNSSNSNYMNTAKNYVQTAQKNTTNIYANSMANNVSSRYLGCYADNENRAMTGSSSLSGQYVTYDKCKQSAINGGFQYFGLQNLTNNEGYCSVSNDINTTKQYGDSVNYNMTPLWSSNTYGTGTNNNMIVNPDGRLLVRDDKGTILWESTNPPASCSYSGSVNPTSITATYGGNCSAPVGNVTNQVVTIINNSDTNSNTGIATIPVSNQTFGDPSPGCAKSFDIAYQCGNVSKTQHIAKAEGQNVLLNCSTEFNTCQFTLNLQSDGNMCLYQNGVGSAIWCTMTNGKQENPNSNWVAKKGKYGLSYLTNNQLLGAGEWIGSDDGRLMLIMQTDGNLVLYTSNPQVNCSAASDGNMYGGNWANAVYQLNKTGDSNVFGKVGYIDEYAKLTEYPSSMYTIDPTTNMPTIKGNASCTTNVVAVDTIEWNSYPNTGLMMSTNTVCGLEKATQDSNITREQLRAKLAVIAAEIVDKIKVLQSLNVDVDNQMGMDAESLQDMLSEYKSLNIKYSQYSSEDSLGLNGIVSDSNIVVLQENYSYLFWSILAIAVIIATIHQIKK